MYSNVQLPIWPQQRFGGVHLTIWKRQTDRQTDTHSNVYRVTPATTKRIIILLSKNYLQILIWQMYFFLINSKLDLIKLDIQFYIIIFFWIELRHKLPWVHSLADKSISFSLTSDRCTGFCYQFYPPFHCLCVVFPLWDLQRRLDNIAIKGGSLCSSFLQLIMLW